MLCTVYRTQSNTAHASEFELASIEFEIAIRLWLLQGLMAVFFKREAGPIW